MYIFIALDASKLNTFFFLLKHKQNAKFFDIVCYGLKNDKCFDA